MLRTTIVVTAFIQWFLITIIYSTVQYSAVQYSVVFRAQGQELGTPVFRWPKVSDTSNRSKNIQYTRSLHKYMG